MQEINKIILDMTTIGTSVCEISKALGLSNKQILYRISLLKDKGYNFEKKYYYNGDIVYKLIKEINLTDKEPNTCTIITSPKDITFKTVFMSDLHLGNTNDRLDLVDSVYNFCAKEGINIIINGGDFFDGELSGSGEKKVTGEAQVDYALKKYPFDKNILNFIVLGNHDYNILTSNGIDVISSLERKRPDLIPIGYKYGILNIKNDSMIIMHDIPKLNVKIKENNRFRLYGHTHEMKFINNMNGNLSVYLPSFNGINVSGKIRQIAIIKAEISFINGFFKLVNFETYSFINDSMYKTNELQYELYKNTNINSINILNEEDRTNTNSSNNKVLKLK